MTTLLEKAIKKLEVLPKKRQDNYAALIFGELESESKWGKLNNVEKEAYISNSIGSFKKWGVNVLKTPIQYRTLIDKYLVDYGPYSLDPIKHILTYKIYENEPQALESIISYVNNIQKMNK